VEVPPVPPPEPLPAPQPSEMSLDSVFEIPKADPSYDFAGIVFQLDQSESE
jgi:hypothetical protein